MKISAKTLLEPIDIVPSRKIFRVRGVFNPTAVRLSNKKIMLYARIAETPLHDNKTFIAPRFTGVNELKWNIERFDRKKMKICPDCFLMHEEYSRLPTISHFRKIILGESGFEVESISDSPDFYGLVGDGDYGVEDPRISFFEKEKKYAMTYVSVSRHSGVSTSLAVSKDLIKWKREGVIFRQQNKDVVIFPEKINGYYVALHRPEGTMIFDKPTIWVSYSKDLIFWGRDKPLVQPRRHGWDHLRIGCGTVPLKTNEGWLELYHGVQLQDKNDPDSKKIYTTGALLFDRDNPEKVIARTPVRKPLFKARLKSERIGFLDKIVFTSSALLDSDERNLLVYGGGADSATTVRKVRLKDVLNSLEWKK